MCVLKTLSQME